MNRLKIVLLTLILPIFISNYGISQEGEYVEIQDFETWSKAGINIKLNKKWSLGLEEQLRLKTNSSVIDSYFTELNVKYKMESGFFIGGGFRFIKENDNEGKVQGYETHLRYNLDLGYKHSLDRLKLGYRLRMQSKNEIGSTAGLNSSPTNTLRLKIGGEYNIKKWKFDPKLSIEVFNRFEEGQQNGLNKFRTTLGTTYDLKKYGDLAMFYRIERELNPLYEDYPKITYILGVSYIYTIKLKKDETSKK